MTDSEILAAIDAAQQQHEETLRCLCGCRAAPAPGRCFVAQVCFERWLARDVHPDRRAPVQPLPDRTAEYERERLAAEQRHAECPPVRRRPDDEPWAVLDQPDAVPERPRCEPAGPVAGGPVVLGETSCPLPWPPVGEERAELRRRLEEELVALTVQPRMFAGLRDEPDDLDRFIADERRSPAFEQAWRDADRQEAYDRPAPRGEATNGPASGPVANPTVASRGLATRLAQLFRRTR